MGETIFLLLPLFVGVSPSASQKQMCLILEMSAGFSSLLQVACNFRQIKKFHKYLLVIFSNVKL